MFLHCECGWSQDDFWSSEFSPLENPCFNALKKELLQGRLYLPVDKPYPLMGNVTILHDDNGNEFSVVSFPVPPVTNARIIPRTGVAGSHTKLVIDMPMHVPPTPNPLLPASNSNKRIYQYVLQAPSQ